MDVLNSKVASLGIKKKYPRNAFLFLAQEEAKGFFYLLDGEVRVFRMNDAGREIEIVRLRPGEFLGEAIALAAAKFPAFARADQDTEVLFFDRRSVLRTIREDPAAAEYFVSLLARKCILLNERMEALSLRTVRQRLARYLLARCPEEPPFDIELAVKKLELARHLGTISETLSRNFRGLEKDGLIQVQGRRIRIMDRGKLSREVG
jgi:CRP/FNR family transcriptional regulator